MANALSQEKMIFLWLLLHFTDLLKFLYYKSMKQDLTDAV